MKPKLKLDKLAIRPCCNQTKLQLDQVTTRPSYNLEQVISSPFAIKSSLGKKLLRKIRPSKGSSCGASQ